MSKRLSSYYSTTYMEDALKRSNSHIYRALLKNGYSNFSLTILDYCSPEQCIEREDYYLCSLPHEYNILPKAGSRLGHNHSDETKKIISDANKGKTHSNKTKQIMSDVHKKIDNPGRYKTGHKPSEETKKKISEALAGKSKPKPEGSGRASQQIEVTDIKNNQTTTYDSMGEAARALNLNKSVIRMYFIRNQQKPYKGIYTFKKLLQT